MDDILAKIYGLKHEIALQRERALIKWTHFTIVFNPLEPASREKQEIIGKFTSKLLQGD